MFKICPMPKEPTGVPYLNITGGALKSKFSIHEKPNGYLATSAKGNSELIAFLDSRDYLTNKEETQAYFSWSVQPGKVVTLQNEVMREFT